MVNPRLRDRKTYFLRVREVLEIGRFRESVSKKTKMRRRDLKNLKRNSRGLVFFPCLDPLLKASMLVLPSNENSCFSDEHP